MSLKSFTLMMKFNWHVFAWNGSFVWYFRRSKNNSDSKKSSIVDWVLITILAPHELMLANDKMLACHAMPRDLTFLLYFFLKKSCCVFSLQRIRLKWNEWISLKVDKFPLLFVVVDVEELVSNFMTPFVWVFYRSKTCKIPTKMFQQPHSCFGYWMIKSFMEEKKKPCEIDCIREPITAFSINFAIESGWTWIL